MHTVSSEIFRSRDFEKKLLNDESLEVTVVISRFFFHFSKKNVKKIQKNMCK